MSLKGEQQPHRARHAKVSSWEHCSAGIKPHPRWRRRNTPMPRRSNADAEGRGGCAPIAHLEGNSSSRAGKKKMQKQNKSVTMYQPPAAER